MSVQTALSVQEQTERNMELARRFDLSVIANPALLDEIPNGVQLALIPDDEPELAELNIELGLTSLRRGKNVYFRHVRLADLPE